jgi:hypothetical protein
MKAKIRRKNRRPQRKQKWVPIAILIIGVILIGVGVISYTGGTSSDVASAEYHPDDVAHDQPIFGVHEMADGPPIPFLPANEPQPAIVVPEKSFNFGAIGAKDIVERTFIIRNEGEAPLTISRVYTTCGCTTAEVSASIIPPGKVATVKIVFDAGFHDAAGQTVRRGVIIEHNDPNRSQAEIWVQAAIRSN